MGYQPYGDHPEHSAHPAHAGAAPQQTGEDPYSGAFPPPPAAPSQPLYPPPPAYPPQYAQYPMYPPPPAYPPPPMGYYPPPYPVQPEQGSGLAIAGLILGIVSIPTALNAGCGLIFGILGLIFSIQGRRSRSHRGLATGGLVCSIIGLSITALYGAFMILSITQHM